MKTIDLAYLAGVVDSDGCITIGVDQSPRPEKNAPRFFQLIAVRQCDPEAVHLAQELFGGRITVGKPGSLRGRPSHDWVVANRKACAVAKALLPYLRIKRKQAEIVLRMGALKNKGREANTYLDPVPIMRRGKYGGLTPLRRRYLKPEVLAEYKAMVLEIRALNDTRLADPFMNGLRIKKVA